MSDSRWYSDALNRIAQGDFCYARGDWRGAYAAYGTAVEFLLKAIYLRNTQRTTMPAEMRTAASHDFTFVAKAAGLEQGIHGLVRGQRRNWLVVRDWDQGKRYPNEAFPSREAKDLKTALFNPSNGIWSWLVSIYLSN